jgi:predicted ATPase
MRVTAFRVEHYRSVLDSGWVEIGDMTAIVGKNESGKTSLLKALWKCNPFGDAPYDLDREWPRGHRRERALDQPAVTVRFAFTPAEIAELGALAGAFRSLTGVEVQRDYGGNYTYAFLPVNPDIPQGLKWVFTALKESMEGSPYLSLDTMRAGYRATMDALLRQERQLPDDPYRVSADDPAAVATLPRVATTAEELQAQLTAPQVKKHPLRAAVELVQSWLPTFVYMDDYKVFTGAAQLDALAQRRRANKLTDEDRTILQIMAMAGLDLEAEVEKVMRGDVEQRMLDMADASKTLTDEIAHRWSQKKYEVMFQADGYHFITFVKDADTGLLIPLEERSKGFQWFFSFDMTFMCETRGSFRNAVILLDEPGLHLHAAAQRDLLARMKAYAAQNQLIYTTHMPYMIDFQTLDQVYIAEDRGVDGTRVHNRWTEAGRDARFTLQAALAMAWSDGLATSPYNLIVAEPADFWLLDAVSALFTEAGQPGLDPRFTVTPAGGSLAPAYIGTLLHGPAQRTAVLLAQEPAVDDRHAALLQAWMDEDVHLVKVGETLGRPAACALEDLFPLDYYLAEVHAAYHQELGDRPLPVPVPAPLAVLPYVQGLFAAYNLPFDRTRVARRLLQSLAQSTYTDLPAPTREAFATLFAALNEIMAAWMKAERA